MVFIELGGVDSAAHGYFLVVTNRGDAAKMVGCVKACKAAGRFLGNF